MNHPQDKTPCPILVIDDNPAIHEDIRKILADRPGTHPDYAELKSRLFGQSPASPMRRPVLVESATQGLEGLRMAEQRLKVGDPYALAFVDVRMPPGLDGIETIRRLWLADPRLQVVLCTAYSDYSWEEIFQHVPKADNLLILKKPFENIEVLQLVHALLEKWKLAKQMDRHLEDLQVLVAERTVDLTSANARLQEEVGERKRIEEALRESEERFAKAFSANPTPMALVNLKDECILGANPAFEALTGFTLEALVGRTPEALHLWVEAPPLGTILRGQALQVFTKDSGLRDVLLSQETFTIQQSELQLMLLEDVTDKRRLEGQLLQAQKMEAVGQLAAGVAHDFNNILQIIQGYGSILAEIHGLPDTCHKPLAKILGASERAAKLVKQLLTFSRKSIAQKHAVDIRGTLANLAEMLPRLLPETIAISINVAPTIPPINVDEGLIEQAMINLAVNARDAMPDGGWLHITADEVELSPHRLHLDGLNQGTRFICLAVSDTGCGMSPEILSKVFDPFFTTKDVGKGTGLGLSTVYGIAKQHDGWVEVQSQPGKGSKFRLYLPVYERQEDLPAPVGHDAPQTRGCETILVAEDEPELRSMLSDTLTAHGYQVLEAASGPEALDVWNANQGIIQLLLTDMVMPGGITGRQLAQHLLQADPRLAVIYSSGYSPGLADKEMAELPPEYFLAKPYSIQKLLATVRSCLAKRSEQPS